MTYSDNYYAGKEYCICGAVSNSPTGTFTKYDKPIVKYIENKISGPGHNSIFQSPNGDLMAAYHVHTHYNNPSHNRQLFIDKVFFRDDKICIEMTFNDC